MSDPGNELVIAVRRGGIVGQQRRGEARYGMGRASSGVDTNPGAPSLTKGTAV